MPGTAFLPVATEIVRRAGTIQLSRRQTGFTIDKKGTIDLVTEVDIECERMARALLAERHPDHDILAEEFGGATDGRQPSRFRWIFDPIDGTTNYAHGLPIFCSSLALEIDGRVEVGAIFDPSRDELFTAVRGQGAQLNGVPLHVSSTETLIDALLVTGFPYDIQRREPDLLPIFTAFLEQARAVRRLGSAALDLCYVAAGRFDGFWEQQLKPWDVAAGALMVEEAGGRITGMDGSPFDLMGGHLAASTVPLHPQLLAVIATTRAGLSPR